LHAQVLGVGCDILGTREGGGGYYVARTGRRPKPVVNLGRGCVCVGGGGDANGSVD
jgi:hypothetical protein